MKPETRKKLFSTQNFANFLNEKEDEIFDAIKTGSFVGEKHYAYYSFSFMDRSFEK